MMEWIMMVSHGLSKTPDLILTFCNCPLLTCEYEWTTYELVNVEINVLKDILISD